MKTKDATRGISFLPRHLIRLISLFITIVFLWPALGWTINPALYTTPGNALQLHLPESIGHIEDQYLGPHRHTIICIEDLHCHYEVQKNIASILGQLTKNQGIRLVGLEGGSGQVDLGPLKTFPVAWLRQLAADYFMKQGKVTGAEYFVSGRDTAVELFGVENEALYQQAYHKVKAFLNLETQGLMADLQGLLSDLKPGIYHAKLRAFDRLKTDDEAGKLTLIAYARKLRSWAARTKAALDGEQQQLLAHLAHGTLAAQDMDQAVQGIKTIDQDIRQALYQSSQERTLDQLLQRAALMERMSSLSISSREWAAYQAHPDEYSMQVFLQFIAQHHSTTAFLDPELFRLDEVMHQAAAFYRLADERSRAFAANLKQRLQARREDEAALIMGGFHRQRVLQAIRQEGMNYIVIKPAVTKTDLINPYFNILQDKLLPLEKLLLHNQINMAPPLWPLAHPTLYRESTLVVLKALARAAWQRLSGKQRQMVKAAQATGPEGDSPATAAQSGIIHLIQEGKKRIWAWIMPGENALPAQAGIPVLQAAGVEIAFFNDRHACEQEAQEPSRPAGWNKQRGQAGNSIATKKQWDLKEIKTRVKAAWNQLLKFIFNKFIPSHKEMLVTLGIWVQALILAVGAWVLFEVGLNWFSAVSSHLTLPFPMNLAVLGISLVMAGFSLALHDYSHAWAAKFFGDDTAEQDNRLSLNFFKHVHWPATLLASLLFHIWPMITILRPIPISEQKLDINEIRLVALAGPAVNVAVAAAVFLSIIIFRPVGVGLLLLHYTLLFNAAMALVNFIPFSILDGRKILAGKAPEGVWMVLESALVVILFFGFFPWLFAVFGTTHARPPKTVPLIVNFRQKMTAKVNAAFLKDAGGKGRGLINMCQWGAPVPPGFVMRAKASLEVIANRGKLLPAHKAALKRGIRRLNQDTGQTFGDKDNPLLVSVRSGADTSMPGMMETVFYIGLNDETVKGLARQLGSEDYAWYVYSTAIEGFATRVFGIDPKEFEALRGDMAEEMRSNYFKKADSQRLIEEFKEQIARHGFEFPQDVHQQLAVATERVMNSWNDKEVIDYRERFNVPNTGTGVTVQKMVFGGKNDNSGAGVVYSRDFKTGDNRMTGNWKKARSGQAIVGGLVTPDGISQLKEEIGEDVYKELEHWVKFFETQLKNVVDVEFTVEDGKLYILQVRSAGKKLYPEAKIKVIRHMLNHKLINMEDLFENIDISTLTWMERSLRAPRLPDEIDHALAAVGQGAAVGIKAGHVVFTKRQAMDYAERREPFVLVVERSEKTHDELINNPYCVAVLEKSGAEFSHASALLRESHELRPCVLGLGKSSSFNFKAGDEYIIFEKQTVKTRVGYLVTVDGNSGRVFAGDVTDKAQTSIVEKYCLNPASVEGDGEKIMLYRKVVSWLGSYKKRVEKERKDLESHINKWIDNPEKPMQISQEIEEPLEFLRNQHPELITRDNHDLIMALVNLWLFRYQLPTLDFTKEKVIDQSEIDKVNQWVKQYVDPLENPKIIQLLELLYHSDDKAFYKFIAFPGQAHLRLIGFDMMGNISEKQPPILKTLTQRDPEILVKILKNVTVDLAGLRLDPLLVFCSTINFMPSRWASLLPQKMLMEHILPKLDPASLANLMQEWLWARNTFPKYFKAYSVGGIGELLNQTLAQWARSAPDKVELFWQDVARRDKEFSELKPEEYFAEDRFKNLEEYDSEVLKTSWFSMLLKKAGVQQEQENQLTGGMMPWLKTWTAIHWSWTTKRYQENAWWFEGLPLLAAQAFTLAAGLAGWMAPHQVAATLLTNNAVYWLLFAPAHLIKDSRLSWQALSPGERKNALWAMGLSLFNLTLTLAAGAFTLTPVLATALGLAGLQSHNLLHLALRIRAEALKTPEQLPSLRELLGPGHIGQDYLEGHVIGRMAKQFPLLFGRTDGDHALALAGRIRIRQGWGFALQRSEDKRFWILTVPMWWPGLMEPAPSHASGAKHKPAGLVLWVLFSWVQMRESMAGNWSLWPTLILPKLFNPLMRLMPRQWKLRWGRWLLIGLDEGFDDMTETQRRAVVFGRIKVISRLFRPNKGPLLVTMKDGRELALPQALSRVLRQFMNHHPNVISEPLKWHLPSRRRQMAARRSA